MPEIVRKGEIPPLGVVLDKDGRPFRPHARRRKQASYESVRKVNYDSMAPGLSPWKVADIMRRSNMGDTQDWHTLLEDLEERDGHYSGQIYTRKIYLLSIPFFVEPYSGRQASEREKEVASICNTLMVRSKPFWDALFDWSDALSKGYSVLEPLWMPVKFHGQPYWTLREAPFIDQRWTKFDDETLSELRWRDERSLDGIPVEIGPYIPHYAKTKSGLRLRDGLGRRCVIFWLLKHYNIKDWAAFAEVYGMPLRLGKYAGAEMDEDTEQNYKEVLRALGSDAAALVPDGLDITIEPGRSVGGGGAGKDGIHHAFVTFANQEMSKAILGQTMTADDGSSLSQANVHLDILKAYIAADAVNLGGTAQMLVDQWLQLNAPDVTLRFAFKNLDGDSRKEFTEGVQPWVSLGLPLSKANLYDELGLEHPLDESDTLAPPAPPPAPGQPSNGQDKNPELANQVRGFLARHTVDQGLTRLQELGNVVDPWQSVILSLAEQSEDYGDFLDRLEATAATADVDPFVKTLASEMTRLRILPSD